MIDRWIWRVLMFPFTLLYGLGVGVKTLIYRFELVKGVRFNLPVISVGNLNVGGSGKTPHVEYLIRMLGPYLPVATLSRGYKRKSSGFVMVTPRMSSQTAGDEPLMYKRKYPQIAVAVSENRALGIPKLLQEVPQTRVVLLDDAFQHRAVDPTLNILLTDYGNPFYSDWLLPSGTLREFRSGKSRADYILVTKCPSGLSESDRQDIIERIKPDPLQHVFFTKYRYGNPYNLLNPQERMSISKDHQVLLVCGIAKTDYLESYLLTQAGRVQVQKFADHHVYTQNDIANVLKIASGMDPDKRMVVITEKDGVRLDGFVRNFQEAGVKVWVLPIQVEFLFGQGPRFDESLRNFLLNFKV